MSPALTAWIHMITSSDNFGVSVAAAVFQAQDCAISGEIRLAYSAPERGIYLSYSGRRRDGLAIDHGLRRLTGDTDLVKACC